MINDNNGPLMFIETYKDEINDKKVYKYDSRKNKGTLKNKSTLFENEFDIENIKIYKYQDKLIIQYKTDLNHLYGIIISNVENNIVDNIVVDLKESSKFENFKL